jgi:tight adherence protein B
MERRWRSHAPAHLAHRVPWVALLGALSGALAAFLLAGAWWMALPGAGLGACLPWLALRVMESRRKAAFCSQLCDCLSTMAAALRAGQSLQQALSTVAEEARQPSAARGAELASQVRMGTEVDAALDRMALDMAGTPAQADLAILASAVGVNRAAGGNLAEVFQRQVETQRERERLRGQVDALTAQGRLSSWVVGLLPLGLLMALKALDPDLAAPLFTTPAGWGLLAAGAVLELIGALMIRRIVSIEL